MGGELSEERRALKKAIRKAEDERIGVRTVEVEKTVDIADYVVGVTGRVEHVDNNRICLEEGGGIRTLICKDFIASVKSGENIVAYVLAAELFEPLAEQKSRPLLNDPEYLRRRMIRLRERELGDSEIAYRVEHCEEGRLREAYGHLPSGSAILITKRG